MAQTTSHGPNLTVSRYTDLSDEPVTHLLAPITGYQDVPLVSLEESIEPVSHLFDGIEGNVWVAKENCKTPADGLSQNESAAIHLYTMQFGSDLSLYHALNKNLRSQNRQSLKPWFSFLKLFLTGLHRLPNCAQTVWRGVRDVDLSSKYPTGSKFAFILFKIKKITSEHNSEINKSSRLLYLNILWWSVSSCTTSLEILQDEQFLGTEGLRTLFSIECQNGKPVMAHSYFKDTEKEIILMPGSYFEVVGQFHPAKDLHIIHLKEIQPPFALIKPPFNKESSSAVIKKTSGIVALKIQLYFT